MSRGIFNTRPIFPPDLIPEVVPVPVPTARVGATEGTSATVDVVVGINAGDVAQGAPDSASSYTIVP